MHAACTGISTATLVAALHQHCMQPCNAGHLHEPACSRDEIWRCRQTLRGRQGRRRVPFNCIGKAAGWEVWGVRKGCCYVKPLFKKSHRLPCPLPSLSSLQACDLRHSAAALDHLPCAAPDPTDMRSEARARCCRPDRQGDLGDHLKQRKSWGVA